MICSLLNILEIEAIHVVGASIFFTLKFREFLSLFDNVIFLESSKSVLCSHTPQENFLVFVFLRSFWYWSHIRVADIITRLHFCLIWYKESSKSSKFKLTFLQTTLIKMQFFVTMKVKRNLNSNFHISISLLIDRFLKELVQFQDWTLEFSKEFINNSFYLKVNALIVSKKREATFWNFFL